MKAKELLKNSIEKLDRAGIDGSRFIVRLLFRELLSLSDSEIIIGTTEIPVRLCLSMDCAIDRLIDGEPLDYVIGRRNFLGVRLKVNSSVLIPRPETEELAQMVIDRERGSTVFADVATGSGAIACALASHLSHSHVLASDLSLAALEVAMENAAGNGLNNISFYHGNNLAALENSLEEIEVIISNPPYIRTSMLKSLDRQVAGYEPILALDGGSDGLDFYRDFFELLPEGKRVYLEIAEYSVEGLSDLAASLKGYEYSFEKDFYGSYRFMLLRPAADH
ncbi:MAG TPA: HemK/PrmC family methyltransferase [Mesotoga infera]|nr:peptide chain release factor N(5)-glutamine methyltransferase [Mesotoga sp.]HON28988.1 HemK/PrmC family methyltransferase [Mesotoga infera]HPD39454.1 HemK/PrmC family methyltransferase [Mesotoga infera]HRR43002.1 HemK/PrmC family methyltransferase [Mesotoga sp.]HRV03042.1 HemK/PrmC family methyltransferase [Mesotoga sp.]